MEAGRVVVGQVFCGPEPEALVEALGGKIVGPDLQGEGPGAVAAEIVQNGLGKAGAEAPAAELGMDRQGVEAARTKRGSMAAQQSDGPAGEDAVVAGEHYAGVGIAQELADLAGIEAFVGVGEAEGFHGHERIQIRTGDRA